MAISKVVSGAQTGVDRGALDAALDAGFPCGGWCPADRSAEDGIIPDRYPVVPIEAGGYRRRAIRNVTDSDATLLIYFSQLSGGTEQTLLHCVKYCRPYKLIDAAEIPLERAVELVRDFLKDKVGVVLNVAGPSLSRAWGGHAYAYQLVGALLKADGGVGKD